jgi:chitin-binding protein
MIRRRSRTLAAAGPVLGVLVGLGVLAPVTPASAHGAPTAPLSRAAACGTEGGATATTAACRAARAANGAATFADWDNLRVAGVEGRDREVIPDGRLCSAGLAAFRGLDLPRPDWPTTTLTSGAAMTFTYRATIAHPGEFRFYVTRAGYDPTAPLRWADLEPAPFLRVADPPLRDGAYRMKGTLPTRTGRQLIYTIWQNAGTDTYYSCSDVVFRAPAAAAGRVAAPKATPKNGPATGPTVPARSTPKAAPTPPPPATSTPPTAPDTGLATENGNPPVTPQVTPPVTRAAGAPVAEAIGSAAPVAALGDRSFPWPMLVAVGGGLVLFGGLGIAAVTSGRRGRRSRRDEPGRRTRSH